MQTPFEWDNNSDQPYQLKDRSFKKKMRSRERFSLLKTVLISLLMLPIAILSMPFKKRQFIDTSHFVGLGVDVTRHPDATLEMIEELGVNSLLIRLGLWEMEKLDIILEFLKQVPNHKITLVIMQDREHIEHLKTLHHNLHKIFAALEIDVTHFQVGSTINRAKWGFFSVNEYLNFYQVAYDLQQKSFPQISLLGPSVIDFEVHFVIHALFNMAKVKFNALSSLLYVDRRGAPENTQLGFTLLDKISLLSSLQNLSPKVNDGMYITETNWPIKNTAPFAPTSEYECVSEEDYANFMVRYYLLAFASQRVNTIFWHQLIAPGYGLVDSRQGIRKRSAYEAFKVMQHYLKDATFLRMSIERKFYTLQCTYLDKILFMMWSLDEKIYFIDEGMQAFTRDGRPINEGEIIIKGEPIYVMVEK